MLISLPPVLSDYRLMASKKSNRSCDIVTPGKDEVKEKHSLYLHSTLHGVIGTNKKGKAKAFPFLLRL